MGKQKGDKYMTIKTHAVKRQSILAVLFACSYFLLIIGVISFFLYKGYVFEVTKPASEPMGKGNFYWPVALIILLSGYALYSRIYYMLYLGPPMILLAVTGSMETAC